MVRQRTDPEHRLIGMMMIRNENDILQDTLCHLTTFYDRILVLDGTVPEAAHATCRKILERFEEVRWIVRDKDTPGPFPIRDGARQYLLDKVRAWYGVDNWIGILHADEFYTKDPRPFLHRIDPCQTPVVTVRLCHFFLHTDDRCNWPAIQQLPVEKRVTHYMWPGTPEDRFFYDNGKADYQPSRHSLVVPRAYAPAECRTMLDPFVVKQYNYRSPVQMRERAHQRVRSEWQCNHYRHITERKLYFVDSLHVPGYPPCGHDNVSQNDSREWSRPYALAERPLPETHSEITPVFIGGVGRTGSTLVKRLIGSQERMACLEWESKFLSTPCGLMDLLHAYSPQKKDRFLANMQNGSTCTFPEYQCREIANWRFRATNGGRFAIDDYDQEVAQLVDCLGSRRLSLTMRQDLVRTFVHYLFDRVARACDAMAWVEQTPRNIYWAAELLACFPNAVFIHVYRDPRDVIASLLPLWWGPDTLSEGILYYRERYRWWIRSKRRIREMGFAARCLEIKFEELLESPEVQMQRVLRAVGTGTECRFPEIHRADAHIGRWKQALTSDEQHVLSAALATEIEAQGYGQISAGSGCQ
jgi:hypothetical protein